MAKGHETKSPLKIVDAAAPSTTEETAKNDEVVLDEYERLARDAILDGSDGDEPGSQDEVSQALIVKKLPKFSNYRTNPETFETWGVTEAREMEDLVYVTTRTFAPYLEDDVDLVRIRFYETVTQDGVNRLVWCPVAEPGKRANAWISSKQAALEHGIKCWSTMRSRRKLQQWTYRQSRKDYGPPRFSGKTSAQHLHDLDKAGLLVTSKDHPYFKKATDAED